MGKYCRKHIGETFNDGKLVVIDGGDKIKHVKVKCLVCVGDEDLHGSAEYETQYIYLAQGLKPCGCSKRPCWTFTQYEIRIKRKIIDDNLPVKFVGFDMNGKSPSDTPVKLLENVSGIIYGIKSISSFFEGSWRRDIRRSVDSQIFEFNKKNHNISVWDSGTRNNSAVVLGYYCNVCENSGMEPLYTINSSDLFGKENKPCMCSAKPSRFTDEHRISVSRNILSGSGLGAVSVLGMVNKRNKPYLVFLCEHHGIYSRAYTNLKTVGCHCVKCSPPKFGYDTDKKGYLYLLEIQTLHETILGYGITNTLSDRLAKHKRTLSRLGASISSTQVYEGSGSSVQAVENSIKALHKTGLLDCEGFRRESLSIERKQEVLEMCKDLKLKA